MENKGHSSLHVTNEFERKVASSTPLGEDVAQYEWAHLRTFLCEASRREASQGPNFRGGVASDQGGA
jgi:hypothetical protein